MPAHYNLDYLTLKHHHTTKLSINNYMQNINYRNIDQFQKKRISAAILAAILGFFMMSACHYSKTITAAHPLTESTFKTYIHNTST